jgi:hypothetical protein
MNNSVTFRTVGDPLFINELQQGASEVFPSDRQTTLDLNQDNNKYTALKFCNRRDKLPERSASSSPPTPPSLDTPTCQSLMFSDSQRHAVAMTGRICGTMAWPISIEQNANCWPWLRLQQINPPTDPPLHVAVEQRAFRLLDVMRDSDTRK